MMLSPPKFSHEAISRLASVDGQHPLTLCSDIETRRLLESFLSCGIYTIQPEARIAISNALKESESMACPIMPCTDFESVAYADSMDSLLCIGVATVTCVALTPGNRYPITTGTYKFTDAFKRTKVHFDEKTFTTYTKEHDCTLSGQDRYIQLRDDNGRTVRFMDRPRKEVDYEFDESLLWEIFERPKVNTIAEARAGDIERNTAILKSIAMVAGFEYYKGQVPYLARVAAKDSGLVAAETGCHAAGAEILMADGTIKKVEDIQVGDLIQGWNDCPRLVLELKRGRGQMARITPVKGDSFIVNTDHILTLIQTNDSASRPASKTNGCVIDVSVKDYLGWSKSKRHLHKLFRMPATSWPEQQLPIDPYFLGLLIGDGHIRNSPSKAVSISKPDKEIHTAVISEAAINGWHVRISGSETNPTLHISRCQDLYNSLESLGLGNSRSGDKFVPDNYRRGSIAQRLQMLAALLDTDGHMTSGGYDFVSKSKQLADDVAFIARSIGLAAYVKPCRKGCQNGFVGDYFRVSISGRCHAIPCRIPRKNAPVRTQKKDTWKTGFSVELLPEDNYYGFTITGDGRYLMGDFTVTHNTGKTLFALSLLAMKSPERALIIAPQGTMRSSEDAGDEDGESVEYSASQWIQEIHKFTPYLQVWEIFSYADYERICSLNGGKLPPGVYVTYYQAMFSNGAREKVPDSWDDKKLNAWAKANGFGQLPKAPEEEGEEPDDRYWCSRIGMEVDGIRSIITPCLATQIGDQFDMVLLDEAHCVCNLQANITQMLIRLQPKYRWALTATPIPNIVSNLFSLAGWIAVKDWFKGNRRNAAFPYAREDIGRFNSTFLSTERDFTSEEMKAAAARAVGERWVGKCEKDSPVISSPARLLKILKPFMAFISKEDVNPDYIKPEVVDVRVPMGKEQAVLYGHYLNRSNVPGGHPLVRARRQSAWLRSICADPAGFTHGGPSAPKVYSNLNPKVIATLELVRDLLPTGQVLIISSRVGLSNTLQHRLSEAGISIARIDSTIPAEQHAYQANLFKEGKASVCLMGIKCAAAYSFDQCPYEIITSIEWSPGPLNQAKGRIDRVTNKVKKKIFCLLHKGTIEEIQYDVTATKDDAATICLRGRRVPREYKPVDPSEVMAAAIERFDLSGSTPERDCESKWPTLCAALRNAALTKSLPVQ